MDTFFQVEKSEWEAFLHDLAEFEKRYGLLLTRLDRAESMLEALSKPGKEDWRSEASGHEPSEGSRKETTVEAGRGFLGRMKSKLQPRRSFPTTSLPEYEPSCSHCGFKIRRPSRFCTQCGADFGKMVCSCGRELGLADRFCDRCGRPAA